MRVPLHTHGAVGPPPEGRDEVHPGLRRDVPDAVLLAGELRRPVRPTLL